MKTVIILYLPGHAGNFVARLFSLGNETMPLLQKTVLQSSLESEQEIPVDFDRLENYRFSTVPAKFHNWQQFHRSFADYKENLHYQKVNLFGTSQYSRIVFPVHPYEFGNDFIDHGNSEFYYVDLDLEVWGEWADSEQEKLQFLVRTLEKNEFENFKNQHSMQAISLDQLLHSRDSFLEEYCRVCDLMKISPHIEQALWLREDWMSVRVKKQFTQKKQNVVETVSLPPNDDFTHKMFVNLMQSYANGNEAYYLWSCPPDRLKGFLNQDQFKSPIVFIGIKDLLDAWEVFNWWEDKQLSISIELSKLARRHPKKMFVIFTSLEQLELELQEPNIHIIPWGGDWVNQRNEYLQLLPVLDKNFDSEKTFISLNRNSRDHRIVTLSYLFGSGLDQYGNISYLSNLLEAKSTSFLDRIHWVFGPNHDDIRTKILDGFGQVTHNSKLIIDNVLIYEEYGRGPNDNIGNFENKLRDKYRNSFVEIVSESSFTPISYMLTEKTAHCFYGCNFPIILSGAGAVSHLRELGLDVFDDIVDHSYDLVKNPFDRIILAIEGNRRLLTDPDYAKQSWRKCRPRFEHNIQVMRDIYSWYENRTRQKFAETLELIG
jgi:hypothetical protein